MKPILMQTLGFAFLGVGALGLVVPILPGLLLLAVGLLVLARHAPWAERLVERIRSRHPRLDHAILRAEAALERWKDRLLGRVGR
jgi:uncharacterized membrane protein YbaN (DUF454 family)